MYAAAAAVAHAYATGGVSQASGAAGGVRSAAAAAHAYATWGVGGQAEAHAYASGG